MRAIGQLFDALFPPVCLVCGATLSPGASPLCSLCRHRLPRVPGPRCRRCGATRQLELAGTEGCVECAEWDRSVRRAGAPCLMEGPAARLVRALKFGGWRAAARPMAAAMVPVAREIAPAAGAVLVPVPLTRARLRERGFDQAELLAEGLACELGWSVRRVLVRRPGGRRQARLGRAERRENARGRFRMRPGAVPPPRPVLLVDDVLTTGATAAACCRALAEAGAEVAGVVTFVRSLQSLERRPQHRSRPQSIPSTR